MYFCRKKIMTTTEAILNYAARMKGTFLRKDLIADLSSQQTDIKKRAVNLQLARIC